MFADAEVGKAEIILLVGFGSAVILVETCPTIRTSIHIQKQIVNKRLCRRNILSLPRQDRPSLHVKWNLLQPGIYMHFDSARDEFPSLELKPQSRRQGKGAMVGRRQYGSHKQAFAEEIFVEPVAGFGIRVIEVQAAHQWQSGFKGLPRAAVQI